MHQANPPMIFHGTGPVFFGLEIEIEHTYKPEELPTPLSWFKYECCVRDGGELVTHPMSWDYWLEKGKDLIGTMLKTHAARGASSPYYAGNHIHVSRAAWSTGLQLYRTLEFMARETELLFRLSGRETLDAMDRWAALPSLVHLQAQKQHNGGTQGRHMALATSTNTLVTNEFRLFQSSLDIDKICQNMECVKSLIDFAGTNLELNAGEYAAYVHKHRKTFPNLTGFLTTHGYIKAANPSRKAVPACA